jgi:putative DNA primase/helicase
MKTVDRAHGRWREILPLLGVDPRFLVNRHGPCPLCGGRDRFRFDDKDGSGSYICGQCGAGNGVVLLRKLHGWDFAAACAEIDRIIGSCAPRRFSDRSENSDRSGNAAGFMHRTIAEATRPQIVRDYLASRGLVTVPPVLLGHPALAYSHEGKFHGRLPAVLAPIVNLAGDLVQCHRIWTDRALPSRKMLMPKFADWTGAACRLFDVIDVMGVAEGVETSIAAFELYAIPTWAAITAGNLEKFAPPAGIKTLIVFGDNDSSFTGQKAAYALANRLGREIAVEVHIPPVADTDWLDVRNARKA